jgi:hypothetical protein
VTPVSSLPSSTMWRSRSSSCSSPTSPRSLTTGDRIRKLGGGPRRRAERRRVGRVADPVRASDRPGRSRRVRTPSAAQAAGRWRVCARTTSRNWGRGVWVLK